MERIFGLIDVYKNDESNQYFQFYDPNTGKRFTKGEVEKTTKEILKNGLFNFSDSLILFVRLTKNRKEDAKLLGYICRLVNLFISKYILDPNDEKQIPLPFRGGVSIGTGYVNKDKNIHIGTPFIRAYKLAESQKWMGGVIDKIDYFEEVMIDEVYGFNNDIIEYDIPFSESKADKFNINIGELSYALNWPQMHPYEHSWGEFHRYGPKYKDLKNHVDNHDWNDEKEKKDKTLDFAKYICKNWDDRYNKFYSIVKSYLKKNEKANLEEIKAELSRHNIGYRKEELIKELKVMVKNGYIFESAQGIYKWN